MKPTRYALIALLGTAHLGCSNSLAGPGGGGSVIGNWEAASVNGSPLPVLLPTMYGCALVGLRGTMSARPDGRFSALYTYSARCVGMTDTIIRVRALAGSYSVAGSQLVFAADSGFSRFSVAPLVSGTINGGVLTVQSTPAIGTTVTMALRRQ